MIDIPTDPRVLLVGGSGFIGRWLSAYLKSESIEVATADLVSDADYPMDVRRLDEVTACVRSFRPSHVVNLAAELVLEARPYEYAATLLGTSNLAALCDEHDVTRFVHTSTQHVHRTPGGPIHEFDFAPDTGYATSKVWSELVARGRFERSIIARPTNVWGYGNQVLMDGVWSSIRSRRFVYPAGVSCIRSYGFVANVARQLAWLLFADVPNDRRVYYVGDAPIDQREWLESFSLALVGAELRTVPKAAVRLGAEIGEIAKRLGVDSPLYRSRYRGLVTSQRFPLKWVAPTMGNSFPLDAAVNLTANQILGSEQITPQEFFKNEHDLQRKFGVLARRE